ncbi:Non-catalytic module family DOC2, partial [Piromyces sp. E2]
MKYFVFASLLAVGAFASKCHPDYDCCDDCTVVYTDAEGQWGVKNQQWCFIDSNCGGSNALGYPYCNGCTVYYTDTDGKWGVENGDWCLIQNN